MGLSRAKRDRVRQNEAGQSEAEGSRAERGRAESGKSGQGRAGLSEPNAVFLWATEGSSEGLQLIALFGQRG